MSTAVVTALPTMGAVQGSAEQAVRNLDLSMVKMKLMDKKEGLGWSREEADQAEVWYKRFLVLNLRHPGSSIVPTGQIDKFWHQHILDTRQYAHDCQNIFGHFLYHFPYLGMRGPEDAANLKRAFERTKQLFLAEFGESLPIQSANHSDCDSSACESAPNCGSSCTGVH